MVRALSTNDRRLKTLRAIADKLLVEPNASIAALAKAAGLSRRTMYRIAATRADLVNLLHEEAVQSTRRAIEDANIRSGPWLDALCTLVENFVRDGPIYAYWIVGSESDPFFADELRHYRTTMIGFFQRAQSDGGLTTLRSAVWMLDTFDGLLMASLVARRNGDVSIESLPTLVLDAFVKAFAISQST